MTNFEKTPDDKDPALWIIASKRARFKKSFTVYVIVNIFLWALWFVTNDDHNFSRHHFPWPLWATLGWGLGMAFQYADAYMNGSSNSVEKEYEKLKNNQKN